MKKEFEQLTKTIQLEKKESSKRSKIEFKEVKNYHIKTLY